MRTAIVTGAAMGNGYGAALKLCEKGCAVMLFDMSEEVFATEEKLRAMGYEAKGFLCNITDKASVEKAVDEVVKLYGGVDILINNAGVARLAEFEDTDDELLDFHLNVNIKGTWNVTKAVIPYMRQKGWGRVVIMSSVTGSMVCDKGYSAYAITKAGLLGLMRSLAREYAEYGITVNAVCPGFILTPNVRRSAARTSPDAPEKVLDGIAAGVPMKRLGTPEEVGALCAFLASDEAGYITGTSNVIDGGNLIPETNVMGV